MRDPTAGFYRPSRLWGQYLAVKSSECLEVGILTSLSQMYCPLRRKNVHTGTVCSVRGITHSDIICTSNDRKCII